MDNAYIHIVEIPIEGDSSIVQHKRLERFFWLRKNIGFTESKNGHKQYNWLSDTPVPSNKGGKDIYKFASKETAIMFKMKFS